MKNVILFIAILFASTTISFAQVKMDTAQKQKKIRANKYTCPMHPVVVKNKTGKCPKCGMKLVPKKTKEKKIEMKKEEMSM